MLSSGTGVSRVPATVSRDLDVPAIIEATARPVLVVGSVPPAGRDWDLFVHHDDRALIESRLETEGFVLLDGQWLRLSDSRPDVVEVIDARDWHLPEDEVAELFDKAVPLHGHGYLYVPAPPHRLLILARKLPRTPGLLERKQRELVRATLADAPAAFEEAHMQAPAWGLARRLKRLEARAHRPPRRGWPPRYLRRPRRGAAIALSGLDGVGKSSQAQALRSSLEALGYDASVVWAPIGQSESLRQLASVLKRWLSRLPVGPLAGGGGDAADRHVLSRTEPGTPAFGPARRLSAHLWSTVTTLANALAFRRAARGIRRDGRIVIYDRYVLDTIVELRFRYSPEGRMPLQEALVKLLVPSAHRAYLLDVPPEVAHERKPDWSLVQTRLRADLYRSAHEELGVVRLDAARPIRELSHEILHDVLMSLRR